MKAEEQRLRFRLLCRALLMGLAGNLCVVALYGLVKLMFGSPLQQGFLWLSQLFLGSSPEEALIQYQEVMLFSRPIIWSLVTLSCMLIAVYQVLGGYSRWVSKVRIALGQVGQPEKERLPKELHLIGAQLEELENWIQRERQTARLGEERHRELVSFLAHDLKTPLTSVLGYLRLLVDDPGLSPEQRKQYTAIALEKAERLETLVGEFFDITRLELQRENQQITDIHLSLLLEQLADELYPQLEEGFLHCQTSIQPNLLVRGDPDKLARVFENLLYNSIHYSDPGGQIEISAKIQGARIEIAVRNQGTAIPEGELSQIFDKFYRLDHPGKGKGGAGLGLAIAKEIVLQHGGTIRAESDGRWISFVILLPMECLEH